MSDTTSFVVIVVFLLVLVVAGIVAVWRDL